MECFIPFLAQKIIATSWKNETRPSTHNPAAGTVGVRSGCCLLSGLHLHLGTCRVSNITPQAPFPPVALGTLGDTVAYPESPHQDTTRGLKPELTCSALHPHSVLHTYSPTPRPRPELGQGLHLSSGTTAPDSSLPSTRPLSMEIASLLTQDPSRPPAQTRSRDPQAWPFRSSMLFQPVTH